MGRIPTLDECNPGVVSMLEYNVLIVSEKMAEKTAGGIFLPDKAKEMEELGGMRGRIVALGNKAGSLIWPEDGPGRPKVGDAVFHAKYGGTTMPGADGVEYRSMKDKDIIAIIAEAPNG